MVLAFLGLCLIPTFAAATADKREADRIMASPDVSLGMNYSLKGRLAVADFLFARPLVLLRFWESYRFSPRYRGEALASGAIHVIDPTGIAGDLYALPDSGGSHAYLAYGAINHRLAPPFKGRAVLVVSARSVRDGLDIRLEVHLRMDNRFVGFLTKAFFPLVRNLVLRRLGYNMADIGTIVEAISLKPAEAAASLGPVEARELLEALGD